MTRIFGLQQICVAVLGVLLSACGPYIRGASISATIIPQTPQAIALAQNGYGGSGASIPAQYSTVMCWGEPDCYTGTTNYPSGTPTATNLNVPYTIGAFYDINDGMKLKFFLTDRSNNRVLIFNSIPTSPASVPDVVLGQPGFTTGASNFNQGGPPYTMYGFDTNSHLTVCPNGLMFVADRSNNRVLGYNQVPTTNGAAADFVIGQTCTSGSGKTCVTGQSPGTTSNTLSAPSAVHCFNNMLFIVEKTNNRILVFNPIPTTTNPTASFAIGAPTMTTVEPGTCSASTFASPYEAAYDGTSLYVVDGSNNRVVIYNPIPTAAGAIATAVVGQPNLGVGEASETGNCAVNQGAGNPSKYTLDNPESLTIYDNWLGINDGYNHRMTFYNLPITAGVMPAAAYQWGQLDMNSVRAVAATPYQISSYRGIIISGSMMWAPDEQYNRLMVVQLPFTP